MFPLRAAENGCVQRALKKKKKNVYCEGSKGISLPIHGNEGCAINWALRALGAQQEGEEGRRKKTVQCNKLPQTIYTTQE